MSRHSKWVSDTGLVSKKDKSVRDMKLVSRHSKWVSDKRHVSRNSKLVGEMELQCQGMVNGSVTQDLYQGMINWSGTWN